ncbi:MAG: hypothetical protein M1142_04830 [Patescibacteria group bacterium]|nr:hypothetical protein [Patescibacteria group bacterium]
MRQCLGTSISKESEVSWNILAGDQWDEFMRGHLYNLDKPQNPLEAAQKWRGVMDDVLKVRPIHRAALP